MRGWFRTLTARFNRPAPVDANGIPIYTGTNRVAIMMNERLRRGVENIKDYQVEMPSYPMPFSSGMGDAIVKAVSKIENLQSNRKDAYLMGFAEHAATASKDSTKVGAVLVRDNKVHLTAYNGPPKGVQDLPERFERPTKYLFASHAEANLIAFAARAGIQTEGCTVYSTHQPCAACTRTLIQAGIKQVYYSSTKFGPGSPYSEEADASATMFAEAGIVCQQINPERK